MADNQKIEVFGNLRKAEMVRTIDDKILRGTLVFDSLNPYPGYYHETPQSSKPIYLYLVLAKQYPLEEILRVTQKIEENYDWAFDAGKGYMNVGSEFLNVIRVRHVPNLELVEKIQEAYEENGIEFSVNKRVKGQFEAQVKIVKFLFLEVISDRIFLDINDGNTGYIKLPRYLDSKEFIQVSTDVKYNWDGHEYDAARASFFKTGKLHELVRIYSNKITPEYLENLHDLYLKKIK